MPCLPSSPPFIDHSRLIAVTASTQRRPLPSGQDPQIPTRPATVDRPQRMSWPQGWQAHPAPWARWVSGTNPACTLTMPRPRVSREPSLLSASSSASKFR